MRQNPRSIQVAKADAEIRMMVWRAQEELGVTNIEMLQILSGMEQSVLKYMLRAERHPEDPDMAADLA